MTKKDIVFIQYLRPNGVKNPITISRPELVADKATELKKQGWRFEAEVLTTGEVSLTAEFDNAEGDVCKETIKVVQNGPAVIVAVDELIEEAWELNRKGISLVQ